MKSYCACEWTIDGHLRDLCGAHMEAARRYALAEREACAKIAEGNINGDLRTWPHQSGDYDNVSVQSRLADAIAAAIRARST